MEEKQLEEKYVYRKHIFGLHLVLLMLCWEICGQSDLTVSLFLQIRKQDTRQGVSAQKAIHLSQTRYIVAEGTKEKNNLTYESSLIFSSAKSMIFYQKIKQNVVRLVSNVHTPENRHVSKTPAEFRDSFWSVLA